MNLRQEAETREELLLSPRGMRSHDSRGRERPEEPCQIRTDFQRDRDRIIHSKAFRRLKHKTQVFIIPEGDHFRTRLTHTLEVAQISRTVSRALGLNEDLTEAIALGHDLGHTPFGHAGEEALSSVFPEGFRHNEQSLRVVDHLEGNNGLNLTWEVRDGIRWHTGQQDPETLEGQVVRICDRVAYINHDIDDALRGGILQEEDLPEYCLEILGFRHRDRINTMVVDLIANNRDGDQISMTPRVQRACDDLRQFLFDRVYIGSAAKAEEAKAKRLLRELYYYYVEHPEAVPEKNGDGPERSAVDYIAGMTDRYVIAQYEKLFVPQGFHQY